jgi:hypothetical protein
MKYSPLFLILTIFGCDQQPPVVRPRTAAKPVTVEWRKYWIGEMAFESPLPLLENSAAGHEEVLSREGLERTSDDTFLTVAAIHQTTRKGHSYDLDNAAQGAIISVAKNEGDVAPEVSLSEVKISGVPARRAVYRGDIRGKPTWIDSVCVIADQDLWAVIVVRRVKEQNLLTERILDSVRLSDAAAASYKAPPNEAGEEKRPPYDPAYRDIEAWIKANDPGPLIGRQRWWPVADQIAIYAELLPRYREWRESNPGDQMPPDEFEDLYLHEKQNELNGVDDPIRFPQKLLRLRYFIEVDRRPLRKDRVFVLHDGRVRRIEEADIVFSKSYAILQSFRLDMLAPE